MKLYIRETTIDVIKWGIIIVIAAIAFYVVCPKYEVFKSEGGSLYRYNKFSGKVESYVSIDGIDGPITSFKQHQYRWKIIN